MASFNGCYSHGEPAFMTCILKVDYQTSRWRKAVRGVLKSSWGVRSFKMDRYGMVEVSGMMDPYLLLDRLRRAGRAAELCYWQFGQCSNNLFLPNDRRGYCNAVANYDDGRYFPFRDGICSGGGYQHHSLSYDRNTCYHPRTMYYLEPPSCEEAISCCVVM